MLKVSSGNFKTGYSVIYMSIMTLLWLLTLILVNFLAVICSITYQRTELYTYALQIM